jgi:uncharacterized protein (DUF2141 family)
MNWPAWGMFFAVVAAVQAGAVPPVAGSASLTIRVENVLPSGGILRLGVYDRARYPDDDSTPTASANVPAVAGETTIVLHGIPPGTYAIETFQDVNGNNKMDTSWLGLPLEPFGFSRDATPLLSKPGFDDVKFTLAVGENSQVVHLLNSITTSPADKARDSVRARRR